MLFEQGDILGPQFKKIITVRARLSQNQLAASPPVRPQIAVGLGGGKGEKVGVAAAARDQVAAGQVFHCYALLHFTPLKLKDLIGHQPDLF